VSAISVKAGPTISYEDRVLTGCRTMHRGLTRLVLAAILPATVLCGCATGAPVNVRVERVGPETGYRIAKFLVRDRRPTNNPDALVLLAFSGGGTRAAALSYGVLEELRRTPIVVKGHQHSMLDEVDLIAGVSGGSFTALAYALYGERLFHEYQQRFLKRNVQGELIKRLLNPTNWPRLASDGYGRSELAAGYYDEILFGGATFSDLIPLELPSRSSQGRTCPLAHDSNSRRTPLISCVLTSGQCGWPAQPRRRRQSPFFSLQ
jgi:hypothetical protein